MRFAISILIILFDLSGSCSGLQTEPLQIGDRFPVVKNCQFFDRNKIHEFGFTNKKLLILDFWTTYCATCIEKMPEMEALQKQFKDDIDIVLVTSNKKSEIEKLFTRIKRPLPNLPMIINDTSLCQLFPHQSVPHHVWIDSSAVVKYISYGYSTNRQNIQAVINGENIKMALKQEITDFDRSKPLWLEGKGRLSHHLKYYSLLMEQIDELGSSSASEKTDSIEKIAELKIINTSILSLYRIAANKSVTGGLFNHNNRVLLEVANPEKLIRPANPALLDSWRRNNIHTYEASVPLSCSNDVYEILMADLNKLFPYTGKIEKQKMKCLVIVRIDTANNTLSSGGEPMRRYMGNRLFIRNMSFQSSVVDGLIYANRDMPTPIIDDSHFTGNIDIEFDSPLDDISKVKECLKNYGFDLAEREIEIDMLVIRDRKK